MDYWCHICKRETEITPQHFCTHCQKNFIEEIEEPDQHPRNFTAYYVNSRGHIHSDFIFMPSIRSLRPVNSSNETDPSFDAILHQIMMNDQNRYGPPPAAKETVSSLKEILITQETINARGILNKGVDEFGAKIDNEKVIIECPVCKDEFGTNEVAIDMPCQHLFHKNCIVAWLDTHNNCPTCRFELPTDDPDYEARRGRK